MKSHPSKFFRHLFLQIPFLRSERLRKKLIIGIGAFVSVLLLIIIPHLQAADFRVTPEVLKDAGGLQLHFPACTNYYYQVWVSESLTGEFTHVRGMTLGADDAQSWADENVLDTKIKLYYRLRRIPVTASEDYDGDGIPDVYELMYPGILDPLNPDDAHEDPSGSGLTNLEEYLHGTDPTKWDTDGDGIPDGWEVEHGLDPLDPDDGMADPDGDGFPNVYEWAHGTDPNDPDSRPSPTLFVDADASPRGDGSAGSPFNTIQAALDAAVDYDIIALANGVYRGEGNKNLNFQGKPVMVMSVDGGSMYERMTFDTGETGRVLPQGGLFEAINASGRVIIDCEGSGSGVIFDQGEDNRTILSGVTIRDADASGIQILGSGPTISSVTVEDNMSVYEYGEEFGGEGGGIFISGGFPVIVNSIIRDNLAPYGSGGGVYMIDSLPLLINLFIIGNDAGFGGGALMVVDSEPTFTHMTIGGNRTRHGRYGALKVIGPYRSKLRNSIIWGNGELPIIGEGGADMDFSHSIIQDGYSGNVILTNNPLFRPNYRLSPESPAIGGGDAAIAPLKDIDGEPRLGMPDMGADQYVDTIGDGIPDVWKLHYFSDIWSTDASATNDFLGDGLTNYDEYLHGTNPTMLDTDGDGLSDYDEIHVYGTDPTNPDTDGDGLPDGWEVEHGFDPLDPTDAMQDMDGDGFNVVYEYHHGTCPTNPLCTPTPTLYVDANAEPGGDGSQEQPFATIGEALAAGQDYSIIELAPGVYKGPGNKNLNYGGKDLMIVSREGARTTIIDCEHAGRAFVFHSGETRRAILRGVTIRNASLDAISCVGSSPLIDRCLIVLNNGSGLALQDAHPVVQNCTIADNLDAGIRADAASSPTVRNTIIWDNSTSISGGTPAVTFSCKPQYFQGEGNIRSNPRLVPGTYHLTADSPCIDAGTTESVYWWDMDNEEVWFGAGVDIGADEFVDTDEDGLPDWWEELYFGGPTAADPEGHGDNDRLNNLAEYELGTNPLEADTSGDGIWDCWLVANNLDPTMDNTDLWSPEMRFRNGGFDEGNPQDITDIPSWEYGWGESRAISDVAHEGVRSVVIWGDMLSAGLWQEFIVFGGSAAGEFGYGEELVLTGYMMTPSGENRLTDGQSGLIAFELFDAHGEMLSVANARLTCRHEPDIWHRFDMTQFVPHNATHARAVLKVEGHGTGHVYFDTLSLAVSKDSDWDGLPDWWEELYFDHSTAADAFEDPDEDGLLNYEEYIHGTDPTNPDTDGDGIPDGWEVEMGLDPLCPADAAMDFDGDGLTNLEEYLAGTNPWLADSVGDGLTDYERVKLGFSDFDEYQGFRSVIVSVNGSDAVNTFGLWAVEGDHIYARERSGYLDYVISVPSEGLYVLEVEGTQRNSLTSQRFFDLTVSVNEWLVGRRILEAPYGTSATVRYYLPRLAEGDHLVRIEWSNLHPNTFLKVLEVRLVSLDGEDVPDWQGVLLEDMFDLGIPPEESLVSPVCVEGRSWFPEGISLNASYIPPGETSQVVGVRRGAGDGWFADIFLSPTNATVLEVTEENRNTTYTNVVVWTELNILTHGTNTVLLRKGDALLLTAKTNDAVTGTMGIGIEGVTNYAGSIEHPIPHGFEEAGLFTVTGTYTNDVVTNGQITVQVVSASFNGTPACLIGVKREWDCPLIPDEAVIKGDPRLHVEEIPWEGGGRRFLIGTWTEEARYIVARLGTEDGPILAHTHVAGIRSAQPPYWRVIQSFSDGSRLVEARLYLGNIPDDLTVEFNIFVGGVTFDDGTISRTITADDFNEFGEYVYYMLQSRDTKSATCHTTKIYQDGKYMGGTQ